MAAWFSRNPSRFEIAVKVGLPLLILLVVVGGPIWWVVDLLQPNHRTYIQGCVSASGLLRGKDAHYVRLSIGSSGFEYAGEPAFELGFEDGKVLSFPDPDRAIIDELSDGPDDPIYGMQDWPAGTKQWGVPGTHLMINENRILQVELYGFTDSATVYIRTGRTKEWHTMPMTDDGLIELFGEADRVIDEWRH